MKLKKSMNIALILVVLLIGTITLAQTQNETVEMVFYNDLALGVPFQDIYIDTGEGMVKRVELSDPISSLFEPVYSTTFNNPADMEPPFDVGPYEMGQPLGMTLGDWLAARGTGTYIVSGDQATLDLQFKNLVPMGVYTLWCVDFNITSSVMNDDPCGAMDGSENMFVAGEDGSADMVMEIDAFPAPTADMIYTVALAYHSDGQTYGERAGEFGHNVHVQLVYDFLPPEME